MPDSEIQMAGVSSVVWEDDDGRRYRRVMTEDGIKDVPMRGIPR